MGKKSLLIVMTLIILAGGGAYFWMGRSADPGSPAAPMQARPAPKPPGAVPAVPKAPAGHPLPGEMVEKEQNFLESDYGFSMVLQAGWKVVSWSDPVPPPPGKRRTPYKIRMEDSKTGSLFDFAVYPFSEKSRYAVEEIFISKIDPPMPGYELDIQLDEVLKEGEMRIRRAEMLTRNVGGAIGKMKTYYYLSADKLYTFSLMGSEQTFLTAGPAVSRILDEIRILG